MISPLKDILIASGLGIGAAMIWKNHHKSEFARIDAFYKWYNAQQPIKKGADDDE